MIEALIFIGISLDCDRFLSFLFVYIEIIVGDVKFIVFILEDILVSIVIWSDGIFLEGVFLRGGNVLRDLGENGDVWFFCVRVLGLLGF